MEIPGGNFDVNEGKATKITCDVTTNIDKYSINWKRNEIELSGKEKYSYRKDGRELTISDVRRGDSGYYTCTAWKGTLTSSSNSVLLTVLCKFFLSF